MSLAFIARKILPAPVFSWLKMKRLKRQFSQFEKYVVEREFAGYPIKIEIGDPVAKHWYDLGNQDADDVKILLKGQLKKGSTVFDIGAHQAVVALSFAFAVGENGKVIAVEAGAENARAGLRNIELNNAANTTMLHAAGAAESGVLRYEYAEGAMAKHDGKLGAFEVRAVSVDELTELYGRPSSILIDVEGFEVEVLKGASKTLELRPDFIVEVHVNVGLEKFGGSVSQVISYFPSAEYDLFFMEKGELIPFSPESPRAESRFYIVAFAKNPLP
jgi:FkbM family methyltransferase